MKGFICTIIGILFGMIAAGVVTSHVYKLGLLNEPQGLKCQVVTKSNYVAGTFESEVKRTE